MAVTEKDVQLNTVVLLIEENRPPLSWALGRIVKLHFSKDGKVRSVDVRTQKGTYTRPIVKLAPLPLANEEI